MNRTALLLALALTACVDSGCPKGSEEVDGICMETSSITRDGGTAGSSPAGSGGRGSRDTPGTSGRGSSGSGADAGADVDPDASSDAAADPQDAGTSTCEPGFTLQDGACTDIDECADGSAGCDPNATCRNEPGTYACECPPGYEGDGTTCTENPCEPRVNPCDAATTTCRADGATAVCDCLEGLGRCDGDESACNTDLRADRAHCGACGAACAGNLACVEGACEQAVTRLALGLDHSCAIARDGEVLCWGDNFYGELARANTSRPLYEPTPTQHGQARLLASTSQATCMLSRSNDLICWGANIYGRLDPSADNGAITVTLAEGLVNVEDLGMGLAHSCLLVNDLVECWGVNDIFAVGISEQGVISFAQRVVVDVPDPVQLSVGRWSCVIGRDERLRCWGGDTHVPYEIEDGAGNPLTAVRHVAQSVSFPLGCAVLADGRALCWGENRDGQLGNPAATEASLPHAVPVTDQSGQPLSGVEQFAVGRYHACARLQSGSVMCWGRREQLGNGSSGTTAQRFATEVHGIEDAIDVVAGGDHTCVRRRTGQVQCWGNNDSGQLGVPPSTVSGGIARAPEPVNVLGLP